MFKHSEQFEPLSLQRKSINGKRVYETQTGHQYESVTTALGRNKEKQEGLEKWRKAVGEKEASRVSRVASGRGTSMHTICEKYLDNNPQYQRKQMPDAIYLFNKVKPYLDENIELVYLQEAALYSHEYKLAGTVDLICLLNGVLTVVDFKTSGKTKKEEYIEDYKLQCAAYAFMFEERYKVKVEHYAILIGVDEHFSTYQVFTGNPHDYKNHQFFTERL